MASIKTEIELYWIVFYFNLAENQVKAFRLLIDNVL